MTPTEPHAPDPRWPRYSRRPFPPYRYLAGSTPHPTRDPRGHSRARPPTSPGFDSEQWRGSEDYLYAIDLMNFAYWWECHEELEGLWNAVGRRGEVADFLRALILLAAAQWKRHLGRCAGARSLARRGLAALEPRRGVVLGVHVEALAAEVRALLEGARSAPLLIRLDLGAP